MIGTYAIKMEQLDRGFFKIGTGKTKVLIQGSCRVAPYVDYLNRWNEFHGDEFTIYSIDPFNFCWDKNDDRVDQEASIAEWESNEGMLEMISSVDYFIHEYYKHAGMFNVTKDEPKNIYQFGMNAPVDICLPNWNDNFVLFADILSFNTEMRKLAIQDFNVLGKLSSHTLNCLKYLSREALQKFYHVCSLSDVGGMVNYFRYNHLDYRMFHSYNHVSNQFTLAMMGLINANSFNIDLSGEFWESIRHLDMFSGSYTKLTDYDVQAFGYSWKEEVVPLREILGV